MTAELFYDRLAPFYHLVYPDWQASLGRQAAALDGIIRACWSGRVTSILDVACGIGTQALGLAALGYKVTASDLSAAAVARARQEAQQRGLHIDFSVTDLRQAARHHGHAFDLVIACDNSVPHLLTDADLRTGFEQMFACVRSGGGCLISVRDYDQEERQGIQVKPYGVRQEHGKRYLVFQVWEFQGPIYDLALYFVEDDGGDSGTTRILRSKYYAVGTGKLLELMAQAGFHDVRRLDDRFYQPVLIGRKP